MIMEKAGFDCEIFKRLSQIVNGNIYLVGGAVRDILLGRIPEDLDFVMEGEPISVARRLCGIIEGSPFFLDREQGVVRFVEKGGRNFDFSPLIRSIENDLSLRDFTIDAIAYDLKRMTIVDPLGGIDDINKGIIRMTSVDALVADPLRFVRAFRLAGTLGFTIDSETLEAISEKRSKIMDVSPERIRDEFFKILGMRNCAYLIAKMEESGLLSFMIPVVKEMKRIEQDTYHMEDVWTHTLLCLEKLELICNGIEGGSTEILDEFINNREHISTYMNEELVKGRSRRSLLKFLSLLHDSGKTRTATKGIDGKMHFYGHEKESIEISKSIARNWRLSTREIVFIKNTMETYIYLTRLFYGKHESERIMARFFRRTEEFISSILLFLADKMASKRNMKEFNNLYDFVNQFTYYYFNTYIPSKKRERLITGRDIMEMFRIPPGPIIGKILDLVEEKRLLGLIKTRNQAVEFAEKILKDKGVR